MEVKFPAPVQSCPGVRPTFYKIGSWLFPGSKEAGSDVNHPHHLAPRSNKENSDTSTTPLDPRGLFYGELYPFTFTEGKPVHLHTIKAYNKSNNNNY